MSSGTCYAQPMPGTLAHGWQPRLAALHWQVGGATLFSAGITVLCSPFHISCSGSPHAQGTPGSLDLLSKVPLL